MILPREPAGSTRMEMGKIGLDARKPCGDARAYRLGVPKKKKSISSRQKGTLSGSDENDTDQKVEWMWIRLLLLASEVKELKAMPMPKGRPLF